MKVLIAGDWHSDLHEEAVYVALQQLGHEPLRFVWHGYFRRPGGPAGIIAPLIKAQNKYIVGPLVARLNLDLVRCVAAQRPDVVFCYRGTHIYAQTLALLRKASPASVLVAYNNDDPFSPLCPRWYWRHFLRGIPEYDLVLAYREHNVDEFMRAGARRVELFRSWFLPWRHRPVRLTELDRRRFDCDVVFVGHYEEDGRLECLEEIVRGGWRLNLFGHDYGWHRVLRKSPTLRDRIPVVTVWGDDYAKALCGAKIALCFLSKLNRDMYTRRCFEIPACGTLLLAEYSPDLAGLFREGEEADFFRSPAELVEKVAFYVRHDEIRRAVAERGRLRVITDGHDVVSRVKHLLSLFEEVRRV